MHDLNAIAARLDDAAMMARAIPQLTELLTLAEAYDVQSRSMQRRYARGERRIGVKLGFTSRSKMLQMGVSDLILGRLTDHMLTEAGNPLSRARFVHPRVEPEVAFLIKQPLAGKVDPMTAMAAVAGVAPALEIIDSRYEDFRFSVTDVVADNTSAAAIVIGPWADPSIDLANLGMLMEIDGTPRQIGSTAAILAHPLYALVAAARLVHAQGEQLAAGDIVMAGAATAAEAISANQFVKLSVEKLGGVSFTMGE